MNENQLDTIVRWAEVYISYPLAEWQKRQLRTMLALAEAEASSRDL